MTLSTSAKTQRFGIAERFSRQGDDQRCRDVASCTVMGCRFVVRYGVGRNLDRRSCGVRSPQVMPDRWTQFVTDDGWAVDLNTTHEVIDHLDNVAGASNSWQARVTSRAEAHITGTGATPIQDVQLESGYFVGCRTDSSAGVEVGGDLGVDLNQQVEAGVYGGGGGGGGAGGDGPWLL